MFHHFALLGYFCFFLIVEIVRQILLRRIFTDYSFKEFWKTLILSGFIQIVSLSLFQQIILPLIAKFFSVIILGWQPQSSIHKLIYLLIKVIQDFNIAYLSILNGQETEQGWVMGIATFEEITKILGVLSIRFLLVKQSRNPISFFIIAAFGFALIENIEYYSRFTATGVGLLPYLIRTITAILHACFTITNMITVITAPSILILASAYYGWQIILLYIICLLIAAVGDKTLKLYKKQPYLMNSPLLHTTPFFALFQFYNASESLPLWVKVVAFPGIVCHGYYDMTILSVTWPLLVPFMVSIIILTIDHFSISLSDDQTND
jgi:hypothetical protein